MKWIAVSCFDTKMGSFQRPYFAPTVGAAIRAFGDEVVNPESPMAKHPEDYQLFQVGAFLDDSGVFEMQSPPHQISKALDFVKV